MQKRLPNAPVMLLSYINTMLRDHQLDLDRLCRELDVTKEEISGKLWQIGYTYDPETNRFA